MSVDEVVRIFGVPERVELAEGIVVRRYVEEDIAPLVDVVNANLEHLKPWMPWAQEPQTVEQQLDWFREADRGWADGTNYVYGIFDADGRIIGGSGFHIRNGPGVLEIGYWLAADAVGKGIITRVTEALTAVAGGLDDVTRVEIHCDVGNVRSSAVPRRLGYTLVRTEPREIVAPGETGTHEIWSITV
ncbi:MAG: GNAT family N-acetyltransferase [Frankiales bacterium]|nr:GNAT family N-acetyltransferase [Frankiales bacterium]